MSGRFLRCKLGITTGSCMGSGVLIEIRINENGADLGWKKKIHIWTEMFR